MILRNKSSDFNFKNLEAWFLGYRMEPYPDRNSGVSNGPEEESVPTVTEPIMWVRRSGVQQGDECGDHDERRFAANMSDGNRRRRHSPALNQKGELVAIHVSVHCPARFRRRITPYRSEESQPPSTLPAPTARPSAHSIRNWARRGERRRSRRHLLISCSSR
jgi:hypothetical protein